MAAPGQQANGDGANLQRPCLFLKESLQKLKKLGEDDPRRIVHSLKVGLALTLVSLFYYLKPLYDGIGVNALWAVLTVSIVFEFSVGATLGKGLNRMLATVAGGALGVGAHRLATLSGKTGEPILLAIFLFIFSAIVTFLRFLPSLKARYDYGMSIFMLTFSLVSLSGYRDEEILRLAHERLLTIIIGSCTTIIVCICICPVWIGEDLHNLVADNIDKLGEFLEGFGGEYFRLLEEDQKSMEGKAFLQEYETVLNSKGNEESMANLAKWEPDHGRFRFRHPWKQYLKVGTLTRECAYKIRALNPSISIQTSSEIQSKIRDTCMEISQESGKALREIASSIKKMTRAKSATLHIAEAKRAVEKLKSQLRTNQWEEDTVLLEILPVATVALTLAEVADCTEKISEAVHQLALLAPFKAGDALVSPEAPPQSVVDGVI